MEQRDEHQQMLMSLVELGKRNGSLTYSEVASALKGVDLQGANQWTDLLSLLEEQGISLLDDLSEGDEDGSTGLIAEEPESVADEESQFDLPVAEGMATDDSVRMYLKEIGRVPFSLPKRRWNWPSASSRAISPQTGV